MVHIDLDRPNDMRIKVAGELAARFGAGVIGIVARRELPLSYSDGYAASELIDAERKAISARMKESETHFRAALDKRVAFVEWRSAIADPADYIVRQARAADLIFLGTPQRADDFDPVRELDPADFITAAGRPALVIPQEVEKFRTNCMMIAWKDRREARRALFEALPLLKLCERAIVVEIDENEDPAAAETAVNDVAVWLSRHGIKAEAVVLPLLGTPAGQITALAQERSADVIIAGAYGYGRWRELVLGGTTRDLLLHSPRCMFLSH